MAVFEGHLTVGRRALDPLVFVRIEAPEQARLVEISSDRRESKDQIIKIAMWFVYILLCKNGSYYIGSSNNVDKRIKDHLSGKGGRYTRSHKPQKLVYQEELANKSEALKREAQLKRWTKAEKEALTGGRV